MTRLGALLEGLRGSRMVSEGRRLPSFADGSRAALLGVLHGTHVGSEKGILPLDRVDHRYLGNLIKNGVVKVSGGNAVLTGKGLQYLHKTTSNLKDRMSVEKIRVVKEKEAEERKKARKKARGDRK